MVKIYAAIDNNGELICLSNNQAYAVKTADSHYKNTARQPISGDEWPEDTEVCDKNGKPIGTLSELLVK